MENETIGNTSNFYKYFNDFSLRSWEGVEDMVSWP